MPGNSNSGRPSEKYQIALHGEQKPPEMPDDLKPYARELWKAAVEHLPHVLRPVDFAVLRLACECYQLAMDQRLGDDGDPKIFCSAVSKFILLGSKIGLTPHSRRVIKPAPEIKEKDPNDPYEAWIRRGGLN